MSAGITNPEWPYQRNANDSRILALVTFSAKSGQPLFYLILWKKCRTLLNERDLFYFAFVDALPPPPEEGGTTSPPLQTSTATPALFDMSSTTDLSVSNYNANILTWWPRQLWGKLWTLDCRVDTVTMKTNCSWKSCSDIDGQGWTRAWYGFHFMRGKKNFVQPTTCGTCRKLQVGLHCTRCILHTLLRR